MSVSDCNRVNLREHWLFFVQPGSIELSVFVCAHRIKLSEQLMFQLWSELVRSHGFCLYARGLIFREIIFRKMIFKPRSRRAK